MTDGFQGLSKAFYYNYRNISFLFVSLKLLTNFENAYWNPLRIPFSVIDRCSLVSTSHWLQSNLKHRVWFFHQLRNKKLYTLSASHVQKVPILFIIRNIQKIIIRIVTNPFNPWSLDRHWTSKNSVSKSNEEFKISQRIFQRSFGYLWPLFSISWNKF